jgi:hypothetical protein
VENVRIASTPLAGLRPVGQATNRDHGRLAGGLSDFSGATLNLQLLLAEPVPSRDRQQIDWYGPGGKTYTPLAALPADEQTAVLARVDELLSAMRGQGEALLAAATIPSPRQNYIYVAREIGKPENWHPVIVGWAYTNDVAASAGEVPKIMVRPTPQPSTPQLPPAFERPMVLASAPAMVVERRSGWWWVLWIALTLLLLIIASMLLRACGMVLPGYGVLHHIGNTFCPSTAIARTATDEERLRTLTDLSQQLELQLLQRQTACATEARRVEDEARRMAAITPPAPPPEPPKSDIDKRLEREQAKSGELQISLVWDGPSDLDLHVFCPNGEEIYYSRKASCGGTLDVDMNSSNHKSLTPVENVYWPDGQAPKGKFRVVVTMYDRYGETRPKVPFQVRIKDGGQERTVPGVIERPGSPVEVTEIVR